VNRKDSVLAKAWIKAGGKFTSNEMAQLNSHPEKKLHPTNPKPEEDNGWVMTEEVLNSKKSTEMEKSKGKKNEVNARGKNTSNFEALKVSPKPERQFEQLLDSFLDNKKVVACIQKNVPSALQELRKGTSWRQLVQKIAMENPEIRSHPFSPLLVPTATFMSKQFEVWMSMVAQFQEVEEDSASR